jgi:hypothetical protein
MAEQQTPPVDHVVAVAKGAKGGLKHHFPWRRSEGQKDLPSSFRTLAPVRSSTKERPAS